MAKGPAIGKRIKISKYQQQTILLVLAAAVTLGVAIVVSIFLVKYIIFNGKVLAEKDEAIKGYNDALDNAQVLTGEVLALSENRALESVARRSVRVCYDSDGKRIDYNELYLEASTEEEELEQLNMMKMCSALRVIPDALPAKRNDEALMSSLDQIFKISNWEPESLSPDGAEEESEVEGLGIIPVSLSVEASAETTFRVLGNIERSIRSMDISSASIAWSGNDLELDAQAQAYYVEQSGIQETVKTVYATDKARKADS